MVQPAAPAGDRGGWHSGDDSISPTKGDAPGAGLVAIATGRSPRAEPGAGRPRVALSRAHIRTQEGVGPAPSRGREPGPGSPGICQVPGRARAPGRLVPTSPAAAPEAPTAASLGPTQLLCGCVLPGPARPSLAGPRLPAGLGRTSPPARQGAEGRANASGAPGAWAGWHDCLLPRVGYPSFTAGGLGLFPHIPGGWGAPSLTPVGEGPYSCFSLEVRQPSRIPKKGVPSLSRVSPSSSQRRPGNPRGENLRELSAPSRALYGGLDGEAPS